MSTYTNVITLKLLVRSLILKVPGGLGPRDVYGYVRGIYLTYFMLLLMRYLCLIKRSSKVINTG